MTRLYNDPAAFAQEAVEGFAAAHARWVRTVPGGVARRSGPVPGQVAVVVGGGSGHYPAFGGLVGRGLAHGAAIGEVFASPSAHRIRQVAQAVDGGAGVLLTFGNYAGDVLHFGQAAEALTAAGVPARTVAVTDDVSSAAPEETHRRRGVAGDLVVFKAAAAAAETGASLDEVVRVAELANSRTRSFGVAFSGCTLPGADAPLFTVPEGRMAVGLGIHGEPGIGEEALPSADQVAERLVDRLLAELPDGVDRAAGQRAGLVLNGLGAVTYEELFVVYRRVSRLLAEAGVDIVDPEVGELCTSFDMAGLSLTLVWLTDELERLWTAPADAPAFRKGALGDPDDVPDAPGLVRDQADVPEQADVPDQAPAVPPLPHATADSRELAAEVVAILDTVLATVDTHAEELGRIDAVAGDGDHGIGMRHGATGACEAARDALGQGAGAGTVLDRAADGWADRAGGTSGALWGVILRSLGTAIGDTARPRPADVAAGVTGATAAVMRLGKAEVGDKTMVDVLVPFAESLRTATAAGHSLADSWDTAATAARRAADATARLLPRTGRARPHAEKSLGTPDAGAHSLALIVRAVHARLAERPVRT
ncbi:dihydroxyacetone kinase family protein [Streptomyces sp. NPDC059785]|uniref:dihydroxyacetone kinase family protein n=1 Tax=Streptomyces sp. NPDC059785 TaxID=3346945 RepID=UPI00365D7714